MAADETVSETPTRRDTITYGGAVVGGGLLAGCTGDSAEPATASVGTDDSMSTEDDPVGQELTAIQTDRVYVGGTPMQGPIFNRFQLETAAQQISPEVFGAFQAVRETPESNRLFDRQRVADIINGAF